MVEVKRNISSERIRQSARHVLFVEGREGSIDPTALRILLPQIAIKPLGPASHIKSVASALHKHHPDYYFLIDRDHQSDDFVKKCWKNFPDPEKSNLLVWGRRSIENYFIIPEYLLKSQYLKRNVSRDELMSHIRECCVKRIYMEAANMVIVNIREECKESWVRLFTCLEEFDTKEKAIHKLDSIEKFTEQRKRISKLLSKKKRRILFREYTNMLTGEKREIEYGYGLWLDRIDGKKVLNSIIDSCFTISDLKGNSLHGIEKVNEVVKDLMRKDLKEQPRDFQKLYEIISKRVKES
ncbi:MAG: hypothetical protein K8T10_07180 [Candidatus Eremiobacteraeota bacterium]|nr:hypothetical protein [Candidatus Eremiobacteraeota bacterium]